MSLRSGSGYSVGCGCRGLRLSEALALSWDDDAPISVCIGWQVPCPADSSRSREGAPRSAAAHCARVRGVPARGPDAERRGLVFGIYGPGNQPLSTKRVGRYIGRIGKAANVVTNKAESRYATAHDLRRVIRQPMGRQVMPAVLSELMRHADIQTTMTYYVDQSAEDVGDVLRQALGNTLGNSGPEVDRDGSGSG